MQVVNEVICAKCGLIGRATDDDVDRFTADWSIPVGDEDDYSSEIFFSPVMTSHMNVCGAPVSVRHREA